MNDEWFVTEAIDMAHSDSIRETVLSLERQYGIAVTVVHSTGPTGWPEVTLAGRRANIERCLRTQWMTGDDESDDEFISEVMKTNFA